MSRLLTVAILIGTLMAVAGTAEVQAASASGERLHMSVPAHVEAGATAAIVVSLPPRVAAVDGRVFFDTTAAEVVGVAPVGHGQALTPQQITGGVAFGAYDLHATGNRTQVEIALAPYADGRLRVRVVIDTAVDASGMPVTVKHTTATGTLRIGTETNRFAAPLNAARRTAKRAPGATRDLVADGQLAVTDLDIARAAWEQAHANDDPCAAGTYGGDANGDGCVDIADVQAVLADQSWTVSNGLAVAPADGSKNGQGTDAASGGPRGTINSPSVDHPFVVNSTADTVDANNGDGICADSQGRCTLRAAITESNWDKGANTIDFNLPGTAPVTIQLSSSLPQFVLQDRTGGTLIDAYSQPGSRANTAAHGSNAIPGVYLVGTGSSPKQNGFRITSAFNTIRGIVFNNNDRTIVMDGPDAHDNLIAGDWLNYNRDGSASSFKGHYNIWISNGANYNLIGTPALADRNVSGNATKGSALYGPGTDHNVFQNNMFCMTPSGTSVALCDVGTDYSFGPKNNLIGGSNPGEGNVYGASTQQCIEFAHDNGDETSDVWHNNDNSIIGNWLGFRADGSYASAFRCGSNTPSSKSNDSNGINLADGSSDNLVQGNWIGSWWDGVNIMSGNESGNVVRDNTIGESPLGQAAPLGRYGVGFRTHAKSDQVIGNTIRNAGVYGIAINGSDETSILMSQNIITDMSGQAIYLAPNANWYIQPPNITSATTAAVSGTADKGATVEVYKASRNAGQVGLPIAYLGSAVADGNGNWSAAVSALQSGDRVTALQFLPGDNTSGLTSNVNVTAGQVPAPPTADFNWSQASGLEIDFHDASSGTVATWSWDFGDGSSFSQQNPNHTYSTPDTYSVKLTVTNAGGSDTKTEQVVVQSAAPPPAGALAADTFSRSLSSGWGSADTGGAYTVQGSAANYSVGNGVGTMHVASAGGTAFALLNNTSAQDVELLFRVAADKVAQGGNYIVYAVARRNGKTEYRARLIFNSNGSVAVNASKVVNGTESTLANAVTVSGLNQSAGGFIWVRAQMTGTNPTTINVKAWADGQAEPTGWQFSATDSTAALQSAGSLGLRVWLAKKVTNAPVAFSFDDYSATPAAPPPAGALAADTFSRSLSSGWGSADTGGAYTVQGSAANYSVGNGVGTMHVASAGGTAFALLNNTSAQDVELLFRVAADKVAQGGNYIVYAVARRNGKTEYRARLIFNSNGSVAVNASKVVNGTESTLANAVTVSGLNQSAGGFIWVRAQMTGTNPTTINVKAWADGQAEPTGWQFSATNSTAALQSAGSLGLRVWLAKKVTNAPVAFSFDDYSAT